MPEAAMNKNDGLMAWQDDVRMTGKAPGMQSEAIAHAMQNRPYNELGLRIATSDPGHHRASLGRAQEVDHDQPIPSAVATETAICRARWGGTAFPTC